MRIANCLHRPRGIASVMLLVWLFATVTSWANACLVQPSAVAVGRGEHHEPMRADAHEVANHRANRETGAADEPDPPLQACAGFCDAEHRIVAKAQPAKSDGGADAVLLAVAAAGGWPAFTVDRAGPRWRPLAGPPPPGPSVAIAFLRMTR